MTAPELKVVRDYDAPPIPKLRTMSNWIGRLSTPDEPLSLQMEDELRRFIMYLRENEVRSYMEIGCRYGGTFEAVMMSLPTGSTGVAIDFPGGQHGDNESVRCLLAVIDRINQNGRNVECILGPSGAPEVFYRANMRHDGFDAILIDGDHTYEGIKQDWNMYHSFGRLVALHDIAAPPGHHSRMGFKVEVPKLWQEISKDRQSVEFIAPDSVMGIGVVTVR